MLDLHSTTEVVSRLHATVLGKSCAVYIGCKIFTENSRALRHKNTYSILCDVPVPELLRRFVPLQHNGTRGHILHGEITWSACWD